MNPAVEAILKKVREEQSYKETMLSIDINELIERSMKRIAKLEEENKANPVPREASNSKYGFIRAIWPTYDYK
jgi:hypothetical protein